MFVRLATCMLILAAVAVQRNGSLLGHDVAKTASAAVAGDSVAVVRNESGATVVNTSAIGKDIKGYGGPVALEITIRDGRIAEITTLRNSESEGFFARVREGLVPQWIGTAVGDVQGKEVDAISGATMSSNALNATVKAGVAYAEGHPAEDVKAGGGFELTWVFVATLLVALSGAIVPLVVRSRWYRYGQLAANVVVLGFWGGTFLSYELFVNYIANGANLVGSLAVVVMLVTAFVYPYFGRRTHYCAWLCPLGSLQELCGRSLRWKVRLPARVVRGLMTLQECLWLVLTFVMAAGIWLDWIDYELFKAFVFESAATGVIIAAGIVVVVSTVVARPYCRFVCPTGYLFQTTQTPEAPASPKK